MSWQYPFTYASDPWVDLSSYDAFANGAPLETLARMRNKAAIVWTDEAAGRGFWSVTRHADLIKLNKQHDLLSSAEGIRIEDQSEDEFEARKTFQEVDPPDHTKIRMLLNKAFSAREVAKYEAQIRTITAGLLNEAVDCGEIDAVEKIARELPMRMLGQIIGVPDEDAPWLVEKGDALLSNTDPEFTDFVLDQADTEDYRLLPFRSPAAIDLFDYADRLLSRIRAGETVGVLNLFMQESSTGHRMSDAEFKNFFCLLVAAGNDTTRFSISATIHALANQPDLLRTLSGANAAGFKSATDEFIRWASPTTHFRRTATDDFEYASEHVKKGDKVVLWFLSGNRDERAFENPNSIKLDRSPNRYLSFGQGGPHVCLGMFLAKLEVRVVLEEIASRVAKIEQTAKHEYLRSNFILGIKRLPVRITGR